MGLIFVATIPAPDRSDNGLMNKPPARIARRLSIAAAD
jgi:hypothetical protein